MSQKNRDNKNRWRSKTVAFRMSPEEARQLDVMANTSGLSKQDYLISRSLCKDIIVQPNCRVQHYLEEYLSEIRDELFRISSVDQSTDILETLAYLVSVIEAMKKDAPSA